MKVGLSDKDGAKAILRNVKRQWGVDLNKSEAQLGKTKLFVRTPETYFEFERLRLVAIGTWAAKIQRVYRKFSARRHLIKLRDQMGKLYQSVGKRRRRGSFCRPYDGDYLADQGLRSAMMDIINHYEESGEGTLPDENGTTVKIEYVDWAKRVVDGRDNVVRLQDCLVCLTREALYVMQEPNLDEQQEAKDRVSADGDENGKALPMLLLRRRTELEKLKGIEMSKLADDFVAVKVDKDRERGEPDRSHWVPDGGATSCMHTGIKFSLFTRRHHCRFSGNIYILSTISRCCDYLTPMPDLGWYKDVRIMDIYIGIPSSEVREDCLFVMERKTEFAATVKEVCGRMKGGGGRGSLKIGFSDVLSLDGGGIGEIQGLAPRRGDISFVTGSTVRRAQAGVVGTMGRFDAEFKYDRGSQRYIVTVPRDAGISDSVLKERSEREQKRKKKYERRKAKERQVREEAKRGEREEKREEERRKRVEEKRRKKREEKERRDREENGEGGAGGGKAEKIKDMARRSSAGRKQFGGGGGEGGGGDGGGGGGQMTELQKAMAKRRAKAEGV
jgi:myosin-1